MATFCSKTKKIDSSIAFLAVFIYSFFIATITSLEWILFVPLVIQFFVLQVDFLQVLKKVTIVNLFIGLMTLILLFEGKYDLAKLVFVRANLILWFTLSFKFNGFMLYEGLQNLRVENKFALMVFFTVKYIEVLYQTALRFKELLRVRSFTPRFDQRTFQTYSEIFGFLIFLAQQKMQMVHDVIHVRTKNDKLTPIKNIQLGLSEFIILGSIVGVIIVYYVR